MSERRYPYHEFPQDAGPAPWWWDKDDDLSHKMRKDYLRRYRAERALELQQQRASWEDVVARYGLGRCAMS